MFRYVETSVSILEGMWRRAQKKFWIFVHLIEHSGIEVRKGNGDEI